MTMRKMTLNIGCGERVYSGYPHPFYRCTNYDFRPLPCVDIVGDVRHLPFRDGYFDYILASDIIEHFPIAETTSVMREWLRVLKKEGIIEFRLPNLLAICEDYVKRHQENRSDMQGGVPIAHYFSWLLYGGQDYVGNFHYVGFDRRFFEFICKDVGLEEQSWKKEGYNMVVKMKKVRDV